TGHAFGSEVDPEVAGLDGRFVVRRDDLSECSAKARQELVHGERLRHVVVGAGVEGGDLVGLCVAYGQDDDGDTAPGADPFDDFDAADAGQLEIDHDSIGSVPGREVEARLTGVGEIDLETVCLQVE